MINLNPSAAAATPAALGGVPDTAAAGDFLAMLAGIVGNVTSAVGADGDGVLLPGSPLLATEDVGELATDLAAELGTLLEGDGDGVDVEAADGAEAAFPWPTVQALAAMFAQPAVAADPGTAATEAAAVGDASAGVTAPAIPVGTAQTGAAVDAAAETAVDLAGQLTAMSGPASADEIATSVTERASGAATSAAVAEPAAVSTGRAAPGRAATNEVADAAAEPTVTEAAADADAGEPLRVASPRDTDTGFRTARPGAGDNLADPLVDPLQATNELREAGGSVRDRGPMTSTAAGVARVLDAIEQLEKAPPPRQVTLELGDVRVRVAVEDGAVRMQLLGEQRDAGRELLRAADEALRERGFEMAGDGNGDARDRDADQQRPDLAPPRPERGFGRRGRTIDPTTAGVRAGIHL